MSIFEEMHERDGFFSEDEYQELLRELTGAMRAGLVEEVPVTIKRKVAYVESWYRAECNGRVEPGVHIVRRITFLRFQRLPAQLAAFGEQGHRVHQVLQRDDSHQLLIFHDRNNAEVARVQLPESRRQRFPAG